MKEKFIIFLKKHHAYSKFVENLQNSKRKKSLTIDKLIDHFVERHTIKYIIQFAFSWVDTPKGQGIRYWSRLNVLWKQELSK